MSTYPLPLPTDDPMVTVHHPSASQWIIELHSTPDNRLSEKLLRHGLRPALDLVEKEWREGTAKGRAAGDENAGAASLILVGRRSQSKFFSNGFQLEDILLPHFIQNYYNPVLVQLLTFPIPIVCAMNGHTFAAGFGLAIASDYRVMKASKAWASMNEIHFGASIPRSFMGVFQAKSPSPAVTQKIFLEGHRWTAPELLKAGLVDQLVEGDTDAVLAAACELGNKVAPLAKTRVWGLQKAEMYRTAISSAQERVRQVMPDEDADLYLDATRARL